MRHRICISPPQVYVLARCLRYTLLDKDMKEVVTCSQSASCGLTLAMAKRLQPFKTKFAACSKKIHKESDCVVIVKSLLLSMKVITTPPLGHGQSDEHPPHGHGRSDEHPPRGHGQSDEGPHFTPPLRCCFVGALVEIAILRMAHGSA